MKRKLIGVILMAVMVCSLAACGSKETKETKADADKSGTPVLRVAMECGYAPYNWTQSDDSNGAVPIEDSKDYAYGYDVMMAKKIADKLGCELQIVKLDWDSLIPAVQSGTVDCVIAGQSITSDRKEMVDFTEPYYYASIITLVKNDGDYKDAASVEDLKGATVTSQQNTIWYDSCLPQIPDADILPAQESAPAMLVALEAGKCDAVVTDMPTGKAACVAYPDFKLLSGTDGAFEVSDEDINIGISVQKGNDELKDAINGVLKDMTEDDYNKMKEKFAEGKASVMNKAGSVGKLKGRISFENDMNERKGVKLATLQRMTEAVKESLKNKIMDEKAANQLLETLENEKVNLKADTGRNYKSVFRIMKRNPGAISRKHEEELNEIKRMIK
mgnify:CR=1 FL=1